MPRKGENIYHRRDGRWEARYKNGFRPDGRAWYRSVYAKSYKEVKAKLLECRKRCGQKENGVTLSEKLTVKELIDVWLRKRASVVKPSSYQCYAGLAARHLLPALGEVKVCTLTEAALNGFLADKLANGRLDGRGGLSRKSVADLAFVLKSALGGCVSFDLREVKVPRGRQSRVAAFEEEEIERIRREALSGRDRFAAAYLLGIYAGLRLGEVCALRWNDVDLEKRVLTVNRTVLRLKGPECTRLVIQAPKTECSERQIPLSRELTACLSKLRCGAPGAAYVLTGMVGAPMEPRRLQNRFKAFLERAGISYRNFHVLRHTFATTCIARGMDAKSLSILLGHANVKTTLQLYVHPTMEQLRLFIDSLPLPLAEAKKAYLPSRSWSA